MKDLLLTVRVFLFGKHFALNYLTVFRTSSVHGKGGPISIEKSFQSPYIKNLEYAFHKLGYKTTDPNPYGWTH